MKILKTLQERRVTGKKSIGVLIDPDKVDEVDHLRPLIGLANENCVDFLLVGGSVLTTNNLSQVICCIKEETGIPVILFPGSSVQIDPAADAILFLSLISGRNPDYLIGQHVQAAPILKSYSLEIIPTGYILINSGKLTSVAYVSNTLPIPEDKYSLAAGTAMAGEMLGMKLLYLDAGSGAEREIQPGMIKTVRNSVDAPLIVGGGINNAEKAIKALEAGADMIVVGNVLEKHPDMLTDISDRVYDWNRAI
ncbi:MAG: geranylgeranylglyceryl/heptaprenylglyceryl phosphate synthase, partial [Bacteroidetes bacterium]|nr:geranylgeranylglyceryl/heptaprenylglyceryl phosphate synthase [Bacteroidota bacterium]